MEKLDTFNLPFYAATSDEFKGLIEAEGSFALRKIEIFKNDWDTYIKKANSGLDKQARAAIIANGMRAVGEPILVSQFGGAVMDNLFCRVKEEVLDHM
ncbi:SAM dependent carboxyl methyltransferase, partial [Trema orientale]